MVADQLLCCTIESWRIFYFNSKRAFISACLVIGLCFLVNVYFTGNIKFDPSSQNDTFLNRCISAETVNYWIKVKTRIFSFFYKYLNIYIFRQTSTSTCCFRL